MKPVFLQGELMSAKTYEKPDFWTKKAFSEGYPARSVYKLKEMDEKFSLFSPAARVLDLGAAPGSWSTYVLQQVSEPGKVVAIDLSPLDKALVSPILSFFQGDLCSADVRKKVQAEGPFDTIICDAAPATTGNKTVDTARSSGLVEIALWYAQTMLVTGGNFVVKIFQGGEEREHLQTMRQLFTTAKGFKPEACRTTSFETYLIGLKKKPAR